jgi:hypothetical protein
MKTPAFILLVNEETQNYEPVPCTVTVCKHYPPDRTVVLKDGTVIEQAEPIRIFAEAIVAVHFERELNDLKRRSLAAGEWAKLELEMRKEMVRG